MMLKVGLILIYTLKITTILTYINNVDTHIDIGSLDKSTHRMYVVVEDDERNHYT